MNQKRGFFAVLMLLALGGVILAIARHVVTGTPFLPGQEKSVWLVEARIDFDADGGAVTASLALPEDQMPGYELFAEQAASPGYGFAILTERRSRRAEWTRREASGEQSLYYSAQLVESENRDDNHANDPPLAQSRIVYWDEARELAARDLLKVARERSSSPQSLTRELIKLLDSATSQNAALLRSGAEQRSDLLMHLLERADIATRSVKGLYLEDARRRQTLSRLVEFYTGSEWLLVDPRTGAVGLPADFLVWTRGRASVLDVIGGAKSRVQFSMIRQTIPRPSWPAPATVRGCFPGWGFSVCRSRSKVCSNYYCCCHLARQWWCSCGLSLACRRRAHLCQF